MLTEEEYLNKKQTAQQRILVRIMGKDKTPLDRLIIEECQKAFFPGEGKKLPEDMVKIACRQIAWQLITLRIIK